jgi:hypothetical protein
MLSEKPVETTTLRLVSLIFAVALLLIIPGAQAQAPISPAITAPNKIETTLGTLDFKDGAPSAATLNKVYEDKSVRHQIDRASHSPFQNIHGGDFIAWRRILRDNDLPIAGAATLVANAREIQD